MKKTKGGARPNFPNTRKALRKQKRQQKKVHRQEHYLKKKDVKEQPKIITGKFIKRPADVTVTDTHLKAKKLKLQPTAQDIMSRQRQKEIKEAGQLKSQMEEQRRKMLLKANEDEDKVIKKLEKQLGLSKSKNKTKNFANDGLDYLLQICDRSTSEQIVAAEKHLANVEDESDFEEDLAAVTGKERDSSKDVCKKKKKKNKTTDDESSSADVSNDDISDVDEDNNFDNLEKDLEDQSDDDLTDDLDSDKDEISDNDDGSPDEENEVSDEPEEIPTVKKLQGKSKEASPNSILNINQATKSKKEKIISENDLGKVFSDDEVSNLSDDDDDLEGYSDDEMVDKAEKSKEKEKPDVWEDIYGRKRDKEGNVIKEEKGVYIPPHLRNKDTTSDAQLEQLKRQIKSVLNKLSGSKLHWACSSLEQAFSSHSRHAVCAAAWDEWARAGLACDVTPPRLHALLAALLALLHATVATDVGAFFLQKLVTTFDELVCKKPPVGDKTLDNVVSSLAHLYNFKLFHASLLYDVLSRLLEEISEKNIDCVLAVLRTVGGALRKEEPLALKNFIHETQGKVAQLTEDAANGSRIKFLLEVLLAVKNNNLTKIPNYDPSYGEELKKSVKGILRKGNYITPLNIRLEDLLKADERGKWWVVGSAWQGNTIRQDTKQPDKPIPNVDQKLLELARKQRMNTDVRRSIFCVIMSAQDYMDAFEKLQHLGLKGQQEREIVHVLLACCLQENSYNPYYAVLGQKLCDFDRKYQLSIQYSVWDKIKDIESQSKLHISNLAQFLIHLIMEKSLPLSVLKVIQFSDLNKCSVKFMRQILLAIIMNADLESSIEVFNRISKSPKLHLFRESLRLFIQHFLIKNAGKKNSVLSDSEMATLKERTLQVDKILTMFDSKMKF